MGVSKDNSFLSVNNDFGQSTEPIDGGMSFQERHYFDFYRRFQYQLRLVLILFIE